MVAGRALYRLARSVRRATQRSAEINQIEKFVFLVGYGRSGSTLLQKILNGIPGYHLTGENAGSIFKLARGYSLVAETSERYGKGLVDPDHPWFGAAEIDAEAFGSALSEAFVAQVLRPPAGTRVAGFKEIRWLLDPADFEATIAFLEKFFAPAYFVVNVRDPEEVSKSGWWRDKPRQETLKKISDWNERLCEFAGSREGSAILLDYGRYSRDPAEFQELFTFLKEPFHLGSVEAALDRKLTHSGVPE